MTISKNFLAKAATTSILLGAAQAATIIPLTASAPSQLSGARGAVNMINSSEFNDVAGTSGIVADNGFWTSGFIASPLNDASSSNTAGSSPIAPYILTFDLGANFNLSEVKVWNWNNNVNRSAGVKTMEVLVSPTVGGATSSLGTFNPAMGPGLVTYTGDAFAVSASNVREVQFVITEGYGFGTAGANTLVSLAEVRFEGVAIPEPSSLGFVGLAGLLLVRRKRGN